MLVVLGWPADDKANPVDRAEPVAKAGLVLLSRYQITIKNMTAENEPLMFSLQFLPLLLIHNGRAWEIINITRVVGR
jgi:hypothetical protein